jgi:hypothetical protein
VVGVVVEVGVEVVVGVEVGVEVVVGVEVGVEVVVQFVLTESKLLLLIRPLEMVAGNIVGLDFRLVTEDNSTDGNKYGLAIPIISVNDAITKE